MKILLVSAVSFMLIALASGCVTERNYKVLSFFFDGVPDPAKTAATAEKAGRKDAQQRASVSNPSSHGPFAARLCSGCHNPSTNTLVLPVEELCSKCHDIKLNKKWIHGPLISGGCRACHFPHNSPNGFLLVADAKDFCFYCHTRSDFAKNPAHEGADPRCTVCHDPHMSDAKYLLR